MEYLEGDEFFNADIESMEITPVIRPRTQSVFDVEYPGESWAIKG